ncbi:DUF6265 family protein [Oleiharenicola lentus]|uniref:DUF6265 family protein n=1 Tax=Oleiharenicola lentus TaxID=2508720 RepID=UPI003F6721A3
MKAFRWSIAVLAVCFMLAAHAADKKPAIAAIDASAVTAQLTWLAGNWQLIKNGRVTDEHWMAPSGGVLLGMSRTVAKGKVVEYEFMQIRGGPEGKLFFIAQPSGQKEAAFAAISVSETEVIFENKEHDFPQRIIYTKQADGALLAAIEGPTKTGHTRKIEFFYTRR